MEKGMNMHTVVDGAESMVRTTEKRATHTTDGQEEMEGCRVLGWTTKVSTLKKGPQSHCFRDLFLGPGKLVR